MIYINDSIGLLPLEPALQELSAQRREQALKFKFEQGRRLSVAAYLLLKEGLRQEYGIETAPIFGYHDGGKPFIENHPDIHFNLSHCREAAICALSDHPVGIDIESIREYKNDLAEYTMNEQELEAIRGAVRPDVAFIRLWTMKESLLKLTGEGIRNNMKQVIAEAGDRVRYTTVVNTVRGYVYSICEWNTN